MSAGPSELTVRGRGGRLALPAAASAFASSAGAVALLGLESGGYYATAWGTATVAALAVGAAVTLHRGGVRDSRLDRALLGTLAAFVAWVGVEAMRPGAATSALPELERDVLYLAVVWAALQVIRRRTAGAALAGVLVAICALLLDGLVRLLVPAHIGADRFEGRLLFLPLGYANACGVLAAIGFVLALGFAPARTGRGRLAAAALVPLAVALALTQSRGAVVALAIGVAVAVLLHPHRQAFAGTALVLLPLPALAAGFAARSHAADARTSSAVVARDCLVVAAVTCAATLVQAAIAAREGRRPAVPVRVLAPLGVAAVAVAVAAVALRPGDRTAYWQVAWQDARAHLLLGSGPGTFAREWLAHRPVATGAMNAHSLYLETLAELGPLGLLLLVAALALPLAAVRHRRSPLAAGAAGGYATFVVHAGLDWDWQMPAVTAAGLLCGVCALRAGGDPPTRATRHVGTALALAAVVALAAAAAGIGNDALAAAARSAQAGDWAGAARAARLAQRWQPWSAEPPRLLAELALAQGDDVRARTLLVRALRRDPGDAAAWTDLLRAGTPAQRREALARLAVLEPR
jgi:hypothetical protein